MIDDMSGVPRYLQVARIIEREIRAGTWPPGKPVESQTQLAQRYGIAKATSGRAHAWLVQRGYLVSVPGVGMVVTPESHWNLPDD